MALPSDKPELPRWAYVVLVDTLKTPKLGPHGGRGMLDKVDKLALLGRLRGLTKLGADLLEATYCMSETAKTAVADSLCASARRVFAGLTGNAVLDGIFARVSASITVVEVVDAPVCQKCRGAGEYMARRLGKVMQCPHCHGVGRIIMTDERLRRLYEEMGLGVADDVWPSVYDRYMTIVDVAKRARSDAISQLKQWIEAEVEEARGAA